jgi:hypothetical protein
LFVLGSGVRGSEFGNLEPQNPGTQNRETGTEHEQELSTEKQNLELLSLIK